MLSERKIVGEDKKSIALLDEYTVMNDNILITKNQIVKDNSIIYVI